MKRWGWIVIACLLLTGCGQKETEKVPEPEAAEVIEQSSIVEEEEIPQVEEIEEPEEVTLDIIPEEYAYSLTVSINPEVKLYFDVSDIIVGIEYKNEDAIDAYADLELLGSSAKEGLGVIIDAASEKNYLKDGGQVSIELSEVVDDVAITDNTPLLRAQEIVAERIKETAVTTEETDEEEVQPTTQINIQLDVAEEVTEKTGIVPVIVCPDCNGTGNDCKECNGTGDVRCKRCNNGIESCGTCGGSARINCHGCHGSGVDGPQGETCSRCGGSGKQSCDACKGAGTFSCSWCKGELHHVCPDCWGEQVCKTCGGNGTI